MQEFTDFLDAIYGDTAGWVSIVNRDTEEYEAVNSEMWRMWPDKKAFVAKYCSLRADEDTYCSVALFSGQHRTKDDSRALAKTVWADADTCNPENFRAKPSIIVQTSPGRWHCWWVLDTPVLASEAAKVAQKIAYAHRDQGCDLGWFASKILRVPGTTNLKDPDNPFKVVAEYTGELYTLDQLNEAYADQETAEVVALTDELPEPLTLSELTALEQRVIKDSPYENLYTTKPDGDWSNKLFRLQFDLFREGCTPREVMALSKNAACNKFERDGRPDTELWKTVQNAYNKFLKESEGVPSAAAEKKQVWAIPEFLSAGERSALPETFVDRYAAWVAERTDAADTYQRSLAFMLLSSVFGNLAYLPDRSGKRNLNMWILVGGPSTRTRKSTALTWFKRILHGYELNALGEEIIDIGSDATKEGLGKVLGERDGKVSLVVTDEVAGMFMEFYGKSYQTGTISYFTDLYEGSVPVVLRAGKDAGQKKRAKTIFNLLGVGVHTDIAKTLTKEDFKSGFLTRMLWAVADAPPRKAGSDDWMDESYTDDATDIAKWVFELKRRASKFDKEKPTRVFIDSTAKGRYNTWAELVRSHADSFQDEALDASVDRFQHSVRKAAALLAVYDGESVIGMKHLLPASAQVELWYADLLRMLGEVSSSGFERLQDEVESFIAQKPGGVCADSSVRRKFAHLRPQELGEVLQSLKAQGRVRPNGDSQWQVLA